MKLVSVDQARGVAAENPNKKFELRYGQLFEIALPEFNRQELRDHLRELIGHKLRAFGKAFINCGYRGTPEYDARSADIGVISWKRRRQALELNEFFGAPDLVIEVLSPSNGAGEMDDKEAFCLSHGCQSFWLVNPVRRTVKVTDATRHVQWFREGDRISLAPFAPGFVEVNQIFGEPDGGKSGI